MNTVCRKYIKGGYFPVYPHHSAFEGDKGSQQWLSSSSFYSYHRKTGEI